MSRPAKGKKKRVNDLLVFFLSIGVCQMAGVIGSLVTMPGVSGWYTTLVKPPFTPPAWVFGPVWTTLYFLMGVALYLAWKKRADLTWFKRQLGLNVLWSLLFFGLQSPILGLVGIIFLWYAIVRTMQAFEQRVPVARFLLVPYLVWVSFAAFLNLSLWILNAS